MISVDKLSRTPIYEQLIEGIERQVLLGLLPEEGQLPSLRELSAQLELNPNTIQKAYLELDRRGVIRSAPGRGCFIMPGARDAIRQRLSSKLSEFEALTAALCLAGLPCQTLQETVAHIYAAQAAASAPLAENGGKK